MFRCTTTSTQCRGLPVGPSPSDPICTRALYNWGDSEALPGPSTEDWNAGMLGMGRRAADAYNKEYQGSIEQGTLKTARPEKGAKVLLAVAVCLHMAVALELVA